MNRKIIVAGGLAFILALGAGTLMGVGLSRSAAQHGGPGGLARELDLTAEQQTQMKDIWSQVMLKMSALGDRPALRKERDDAIAKLIPEDQKAAYDKILADYNTKMDAMNTERSKLIAEAHDRTRQILNASQLQKYEEILKNGDHRRGQHDTTREAPHDAPHDATTEAAGH